MTGSISGAVAAVGPFGGGWATTALIWRVVSIGEVAMLLALVAGMVRYGPRHSGIHRTELP